MRPIDADKLLKDIEQYHLSDGFFQHWVEVQPTIEERKKGKWIKRGRTFQCSECEQFSMIRTRFCPNCGCAMEGEEDDAY